MGTFGAPNPTVTDHEDDNNGGKFRNQPGMVTCDDPTTTANAHNYGKNCDKIRN